MENFKLELTHQNGKKLNYCHYHLNIQLKILDK